MKSKLLIESDDFDFEVGDLMPEPPPEGFIDCLVSDYLGYNNIYGPVGVDDYALCAALAEGDASLRKLFKRHKSQVIAQLDTLVARGDAYRLRPSVYKYRR